MARTLRSQVLKLSVLPIIGLATVAICVSLVLTRTRVTIEAQKNLRGVSDLLGTMTQQERNSLKAQTSLLVDMLTVKQAVSQKQSAMIQDRAAMFIRDSDADSLLFLDSKGNILGQAGKPLGKPEASLRSLLTAALDGESGSAVVNQAGHVFSVAALPVRSQGKIVGAAAALSLMGDGLASELSRASSAQVMFECKGRIVGSSLQIATKPDIDRGGIERLTIGNQDYLALSSPFPGAPPDLGVSLVALRRYDDLTAPFRTMGNMLILLLVGALGAAMLLASAFAQGLSRPLEQLVSKATAIRDGRWPEPTEVTRTDEIGLLQSVFNDMCVELQKNHEKVVALADTDPLTELDNHRRFKERLDQEVFRATMSSKPLVLVLLDLDKFQTFNVDHGLAEGDQALKTIAELLNDVAPDIAFLARYGGEEFAMLLPLSSPEDAENILERLRGLVEQRFDNKVTFSAGIADVSPTVNTGPGLFLSAEFALSRAKKFGRSQVCRFDVMSGVVNKDDPLQLQIYLQDTTFSTIQALAGAVDAKDPYTQGHSMRVARLASDLARFLGHPKTFVELVYKTATLHDVGKIGVPDSILSKPARLEPEEQAIMETHPVLGELIVKKAPQLGDMLPGVRHHHERWDGQGYPDHLKGVRIPLLARIIAVADTFDAMTSDRPYRRALPDDIALGEILKKSGAQFDPELAEGFVQMMRIHHHGQRAA